MNLRDARRELSEMRAAHTWQPEPITPEPTVMDALTQTTPPTENVLSDVLASLAALQDNPNVARTDYGPAIVTHPNGTVLGPVPVEDVEYWRAAGHTVADPREGFRPTAKSPSITRPFTLPARPRQTFGDVA